MLVWFELINLHSLNLLLYQARGRPQEAAGEVRALLDLMRDNEAVVQDLSDRFQELLRQAARNLKRESSLLTTYWSEST